MSAPQNKTEAALVQLDEKKGTEKMVTNTVNEVKAELNKEEFKELVKPSLSANNANDTAPAEPKK